MLMAYNQTLANQIREHLQGLNEIEEKEMMGGLAFMVKGKMCVGVWKDEMMCRVDPARQEELLEKTGCHIMDFTGKPMTGWLLVDQTGLKTIHDVSYWIGLALDYNRFAKASTKRKKN